MLDVKALKTALKSRDSQLENASERIRELDVALQRWELGSGLERWSGVGLGSGRQCVCLWRVCECLP